MCDEITYPFINLNGATVEVKEWISNFISLSWACDYLAILELKLNHVNEGATAVTRIPTTTVMIMQDKQGALHKQSSELYVPSELKKGKKLNQLINQIQFC